MDVTSMISTKISSFYFYVSELMWNSALSFIRIYYIAHRWNMIHLFYWTHCEWYIYLLFVTMSKVKLSSLFMPYFSILMKLFHAQWIECKKKITFICIQQRKLFEMRRYLLSFIFFLIAITVKSLFFHVLCVTKWLHLLWNSTILRKICDDVLEFQFMKMCAAATIVAQSREFSENGVQLFFFQFPFCVCVCVHSLYCMLSDLFHHAPLISLSTKF